MESAIVTIRNVGGNFGEDMELPTNLPVKELSVRLLEVLRILDYSSFGTFGNLVLSSDGRILDAEKTLDELSVWDGSIITVRQGG